MLADYADSPHKKPACAGICVVKELTRWSENQYIERRLKDKQLEEMGPHQGRVARK